MFILYTQLLCTFAYVLCIIFIIIIIVIIIIITIIIIVIPIITVIIIIVIIIIIIIIIIITIFYFHIFRHYQSYNNILYFYKFLYINTSSCHTFPQLQLQPQRPPQGTAPRFLRVAKRQPIMGKSAENHRNALHLMVKKQWNTM